jgi:plastocyanin
VKATRKIAVVGIMALVTSMMLGQPIARAADDLVVEVGYDLTQHPDVGGAPAESMRFMAPELNVHKGDSLTFRGFFHTATALPVDQDPDAWLAANTSFGDPYSSLVPDPDENDANARKWNDTLLYPTGNFQCGIGNAPACDYTGSGVVNSGLLFIGTSPDPNTGQLTGGFKMTVNANQGDSFWIVCLIHPNMRLKVNVVQQNTPGTSQTAIDSYRDSTAASDAHDAAALHAEYKNKQETSPLGKGHRLHQAWVGLEEVSNGGGITLYDFYPSRINLEKGDKVRYNFPERFELHTATNPKAKAIKFSNESFLSVCDPDGDDGFAPDDEADENGNCPEGSIPETDTTNQITKVLGDGKITGPNDVESSGLHGPPFVANLSPLPAWTVKIAMGEGTVKLFCGIHPFMSQPLQIK